MMCKGTEHMVKFKVLVLEHTHLWPVHSYNKLMIDGNEHSHVYPRWTDAQLDWITLTMCSASATTHQREWVTSFQPPIQAILRDSHPVVASTCSNQHNFI